MNIFPTLDINISSYINNSALVTECTSTVNTIVIILSDGDMIDISESAGINIAIIRASTPVNLAMPRIRFDDAGSNGIIYFCQNSVIITLGWIRITSCTFKARTIIVMVDGENASIAIKNCNIETSDKAALKAINCGGINFSVNNTIISQANSNLGSSNPE